MATAPAYGNMANLCLLCANAQNPEGQAFVDIHGQYGTQLKILENINEFLNITIEAGFPLQVCVACIHKLNVCHELAKSSEKAYKKFKSLQKEWETNLESEEPVYNMDDDWSHIDVYVPSPEADYDIEIEELETDILQPIMESQMESTEEIVEKIQIEELPMFRQPYYVVKISQIVAEEDTEILTKKSKVKSAEEIGEENQSEEYPMLQQPFYVVNGGSQIAIFVAEEDAEILYQYRLALALINVNADCTKNKEKMTEKIIRVMRHTRKRLATEEELPKEEETSASSSSTSTELLHSCQSCKCSFFLQEEMVSHFESLHPEEVHQCTICEEKICGPVQEKHMELHRALEEGQTDQLLSNLGVPSVSSNFFDPEFVVVELGDYPHYLYPKTDEMLQAKFISAIQRNIWIKLDIKNRLSHCLKIFISKVKLYVINVRKPKLKKVKKPKPQKPKCDVCGQIMSTKKRLERHMENKHNPNKIKCCHCNVIYLSYNATSHIESHHNSGNILGCKICDSKFSESGEDQPHMIPASVFPYKCPAKKCKKAYASEKNLENHRQTAHILKPNTPGATRCLCELCGKVYKDKGIMRGHLKAVHFPSVEIAMLTCEFCGLTFTKTAKLTAHRIRNHDPKVPCKVCGKMFDALNVKIHMKIHTERKFACKYCDKLFGRKVNCRLHEQRIHEGIQLACSICKGLRFQSLKSFEEHRLKHERGEEIILPRYLQPVQCSICSEICDNVMKLYCHTKCHKKTENKKK